MGVGYVWEAARLAGVRIPAFLAFEPWERMGWLVRAELLHAEAPEAPEEFASMEEAEAWLRS